MINKEHVIGLTGNIATGKSTVASFLARYGAQVIDADKVAKQVLDTDKTAQQEVQHVFGPSVLGPDGKIDRAALGRLVFADEIKLQQLQAIIYPRLRPILMAQLEIASKTNYVVLEVIRLLEGKWHNYCAEVWVTDCPQSIQLQRLMQLRQMTEEDALVRIHVQKSQKIKRKRAKIVIDTSGTEENTEKQVKQAWARFLLNVR